MFIFVRTSDDYLKYAFISVFSSSGASLVNVVYRRKYCHVCFTKEMRWSIHFKPILLLFVMIMAQTIFSSADVTMLGLMKGDFEVGIYSTAYKIKNIIVQITASLLWVVMPRMSLYFAEGNYTKINFMLQKILGIMVLIGFPCVAGSVVLSSEIIEIVGGMQYIQARLPLIILMTSFIVDIFGGSFLGNIVCLCGKQENVFMKACCLATVVNVILNYILIPYGGANATAFTSAISAVVIFAWLILKKDKRIKLNYVIEVSKAPLVGSVLIIMFCITIKKVVFAFFVKVTVCVLGSIFIYGLTVLLMKNELANEISISMKSI